MSGSCGCGTHVCERSQRPARATFEDMTRFHSDEYINFLRRITPEKAADFQSEMTKCTWHWVLAGNDSDQRGWR
jgi:acetoin utilization deacetylase AcuC-like enzyme